jgi:hypothetical protein
MDADRLYDGTISCAMPKKGSRLAAAHCCCSSVCLEGSAIGAFLPASSAPLLYRGITGH